MNKSHIYLKSLLQDAALNGLMNQPPVLIESEIALFERAAILVGMNSMDIASPAVQSIFSYLSIKGQKAQKRYFPFQALGLSEDYFPQISPKGNLEQLKQEFTREYNSLAADVGDAVRAETLLHLLHKYAAMLPSKVAEEISLYDYAKTKAAIAVCLSESNADLECPFLMVGGDTGGIQEFIYAIVSANAAKNLKGRSYYLHLLIDTVLQRLLHELGLFHSNVVYASGGSFFILAPNTELNRTLLQNFEEKISQNLFADWGIGLSIVISCYPFSEKVLIENQINEIWKTLFEDFNQKKRKRLNALALKHYSTLFEPVETGGEVRRDAISHEEIPPSISEYYRLGDSIPERADQQDYENNDAQLVNAKTKEQIMLGLYMKSEMYRVSGSPNFTIDFGDDPFDTGRQISPAEIQVKHCILNSSTQLQQTTGPVEQVMKINDTNFVEMSVPADTVKGFEFYGGNQYPKSIYEQWTRRNVREKAPKTFSEMAGTMDEERAKKSTQYADNFKEEAFKRLAILRMDVDGLGEVFRNFTGSLAHFSTLSRQLDWFFKGYLNKLWEERKLKRSLQCNAHRWKSNVNELWEERESKRSDDSNGDLKFMEWTQIIYSGGDDLFLVGKWDCLLEFAQIIHESFRNWTCEHPQLGISGGIVFVTHKFPVIRAAELCDNAERFAKEHKYVKEGKLMWSKNSLTMFDHPLHWEYELPTVRLIKCELVRFVNEDLLPRGFIIGLQNFHALKLLQSKSPKDAPTWRWQMAYQIARLLQRLEKRHGAKGDEAALPNELFAFLRDLQAGIFINRFREQSLQSTYDFFDLIAIAARWAEYELRSLGATNKLTKSQEN